MGIVFLFGMLLVAAGVFMMDARNAFWLSPYIKDLPEVNHKVLYGVSFVGAYMAMVIVAGLLGLILECIFLTIMTVEVANSFMQLVGAGLTWGLAYALYHKKPVEVKLGWLSEQAMEVEQVKAILDDVVDDVEVGEGAAGKEILENYGAAEDDMKHAEEVIQEGAVIQEGGQAVKGYPPHMLGIFATAIVNSLDLIAFFTVIMLGGAFSSGELVVGCLLATLSMIALIIYSDPENNAIFKQIESIPHRKEGLVAVFAACVSLSFLADAVNPNLAG